LKAIEKGRGGGRKRKGSYTHGDSKEVVCHKEKKARRDNIERQKMTGVGKSPQ